METGGTSNVLMENPGQAPLRSAHMQRRLPERLVQASSPLHHSGMDGTLGYFGRLPRKQHFMSSGSSLSFMTLGD